MKADILDDAAEMEEAHRDFAINQIRARKSLKHNGRCMYCNDFTVNSAPFCSTECREDHEMSEKLKTIKGLR